MRSTCLAGSKEGVPPPKNMVCAGNLCSGAGSQPLDFGTQGADIFRDVGFQPGIGVEVAIAAAVSAEGDVEVNANRIHRHRVYQKQALNLLLA